MKSLIKIILGVVIFILFLTNYTNYILTNLEVTAVNSDDGIITTQIFNQNYVHEYNINNNI